MSPPLNVGAGRRGYIDAVDGEGKATPTERYDGAEEGY